MRRKLVQLAFFMLGSPLGLHPGGWRTERSLADRVIDLGRLRVRGATMKAKLGPSFARAPSIEEKIHPVKIQGMLFDLGGTLFSYTGRRGMGRALAETVQSIGLDAEPREIGLAWQRASESVMREYSRRNYYLHRDLFLDTLKSFASSFDRTISEPIADAFHARQRDAVVTNLAIRPDCLETLRALKARGIYLAIVSNIDDDYLGPLVEKHALDEVLDHWTSSEEAKSCKPDVAIYRYALQKAGLGAAETLFVGDSLQHDIAGASASGLRSARIVEEGVTTPLTSGLEITAQPDYEISALSELIGIVESLRAEPAGRG